MGQQVNDAAAADAHRFLVIDGGKAKRTAADFHRVHSTGCCPHAEFTDIAFQCRPGSTGTGKNPIPIANDQLAVGADVKEHAGFLLLVQIQLHQAADNIAAYIIGSGGDDIDKPRKIQTQFAGPEKARVGADGGIGGCKNRPGIQPQQEMDHGSIAGYDHNGKGCGVNTGGSRQLIQKLAQRMGRGLLQLRYMAAIFQGVGDAGEDIGAVGNLAADNSFFPNHRAGVQIDQLHHQGGGAIVQGQAVVVGGGIAGFHIRYHPVLFPMHQGNGDIKSRISAQGIELAKHLQREGDGRIAQGLERQFDSLLIAEGEFL